MLRDAVTFPTSGDDGVGAVLIAGGLLLLALLLTVMSVFLLFLPVIAAVAFHLLVRGYYVRVLRWTTRQPAADAPPFDDWGDLLTDGLTAAVIALVYWLPAIGVFVLAAIVAGLSSIPEPGAAVDALSTVTGLLVLAGGLYLLVVLYLLPAAVANFAYHDEFGAAFQVRELAGGVLTEDYAVRWVFTLVYQVVLWPFVLLFYLLLLGFFLRAHVSISVRRVYGQGVRDGLDLEPRPLPTHGGTAESEPPGSRPSSGPPTEDAESGFVDLGELVDDPDRPRGVPGPATDEVTRGTEEVQDGRTDEESNRRG